MVPTHQLLVVCSHLTGGEVSKCPDYRQTLLVTVVTTTRRTIFLSIVTVTRHLSHVSYYFLWLINRQRKPLLTTERNPLD